MALTTKDVLSLALSSLLTVFVGGLSIALKAEDSCWTKVSADAATAAGAAEARSADDLQKRDRLVDDLRHSTAECIVSELNVNPDLPAPMLERQIDSVFAKASGYTSIEQLESVKGETKFASVLEGSGAEGPRYVVAFDPNLPYGNNVIWGITRVFGRYRLAASAKSEMEGHALHLIPLESYARDEICFLAFGNRIGADHYPVRVVYYRFDGKSLQALWSRDDLFEGAIEVRPGNLITLTYLDEKRREQHSRRPYITEVYQQTEEGVRLLSHESSTAR